MVKGQGGIENENEKDINTCNDGFIHPFPADGLQRERRQRERRQWERRQRE